MEGCVGTPEGRVGNPADHVGTPEGRVGASVLGCKVQCLRLIVAISCLRSNMHAIT